MGFLNQPSACGAAARMGKLTTSSRKTSWYHSLISSRPPPSQIQPNMSMVSMPKSGPCDSGTAAQCLPM